ncbi:MAG: hypothetical protein RL087_522, partial [Pseudomonadota bacterium]
MTAITSFKSYTADQIAALTPTEISGATSDAIRSLSTVQIQALSPEQIAAIGQTSSGYDSSVIVALSGQQIAAFTPYQAQFGLTTGQISQFGTAQLTCG